MIAMDNLLIVRPVLMLLLCTAHIVSAQTISEDIESLLSQMTLEEKLGQLSMRYVPEVNEDILDEIRTGRVGAIINGKNSFYSLNDHNRMQQAAVDRSRLEIPLIFGHDVIHGYETIFPINLAQSCSWSPTLVKEAAEIAAAEASTAGVDWAFAPMIDVSRDPRWGRIAESYGEDPLLNSLFGAVVIQGYQGDSLSPSSRLAACMKHYLGYGAAEGGRDYQYTELSERSIREIYLPPFEAGVEAGVASVMSAFNDISGVPATANSQMINGLLRGVIGFEGVVLSDWDAVVQLADHGVAQDEVEAAQLAITAGVDMEMKSTSYFQLQSLVERGVLDIATIDNAVRRMLKLKIDKGLFQAPFAKPHKEENRESGLAKAKELASASMVLLQNEEAVLPIGDNMQSIALVGPYADEQNLMGWWSSLGNANQVVTARAGLQKRLSGDVSLTDKITDDTDLIIVCVGEPFSWFGENNNRAAITLPGEQEGMIQDLNKEYDIPIVTVVFNGRPLDLSGIVDHTDGLLLAWHPGTSAGDALADVLIGNYNPSGHLTTTFPRAIGQVPIYYAQRPSGRASQISYKDLDIEALFPFGYGLSYTSFEYGQVEVDTTDVSLTGSVALSVTLSNTGDMNGDDVVQVYYSNLVRGITRPVRQLIAFQKVEVPAHGSRRISFDIELEDLRYFDQDLIRQPPVGTVHFYVGSDALADKVVSYSIE